MKRKARHSACTSSCKCDLVRFYNEWVIEDSSANSLLTSFQIYKLGGSAPGLTFLMDIHWSVNMECTRIECPSTCAWLWSLSLCWQYTWPTYSFSSIEENLKVSRNHTRIHHNKFYCCYYQFVQYLLRKELGSKKNTAVANTQHTLHNNRILEVIMRG